MKNLGAPNPDERLKEEFLGVQLFLDLFLGAKRQNVLMYVTWKPFQPLALLADKNSNESGPVENKFIGFGGRESGEGGDHSSPDIIFFPFPDTTKIHYPRLDAAISVDKLKMYFGKHFERKATFPPLKLNITIERHFHWQYLLFKVLKTFPFQLNNKSLQKAHCWH